MHRAKLHRVARYMLQCPQARLDYEYYSGQNVYTVFFFSQRAIKEFGQNYWNFFSNSLFKQGICLPVTVFFLFKQNSQTVFSCEVVTTGTSFISQSANFDLGIFYQLPVLFLRFLMVIILARKKYHRTPEMLEVLRDTDWLQEQKHGRLCHAQSNDWADISRTAVSPSKLWSH